MGDIFGALFGSGQQTNQTTTPDVYGQAANRLRTEQMYNMFLANGGLGSVNTRTGEGLPNLMSLSDYENLGMNATSNYINQIARPQIMSNMSLQGLESGGAANEAIAKATAQAALPFVTSLPQASAQLTQAPANYAATLLTGIPFAPGQSAHGGTSSLPLFNLFGMGGSI